jgi:hypothetical protein
MAAAQGIVIVKNAAAPVHDDDESLTPEQIAELDRQEAAIKAAQADLAPKLFDHPPPIPVGMPVVDEKALEYGSQVPCSAAVLTIIYEWLRVHQENRWDIHIKKQATASFHYAGPTLERGSMNGGVAWPHVSFIMTPSKKWHAGLGGFPLERILDLPLAMIPAGPRVRSRHCGDDQSLGTASPLPS